jgi:hypothetical protein
VATRILVVGLRHGARRASGQLIDATANTLVPTFN